MDWTIPPGPSPRPFGSSFCKPASKILTYFPLASSNKNKINFPSGFHSKETFNTLSNGYSFSFNISNSGS